MGFSLCLLSSVANGCGTFSRKLKVTWRKFLSKLNINFVNVSWIKFFINYEEVFLSLLIASGQFGHYIFSKIHKQGLAHSVCDSKLYSLHIEACHSGRYRYRIIYCYLFYFSFWMFCLSVEILSCLHFQTMHVKQVMFISIQFWTFLS